MSAYNPSQKPIRLFGFSVFAAVLAASGLPIYIYAPNFYAENFGVSLTMMALVLFWLRLFDAVQDPLFGWVVERFPNARPLLVAFSMVILAVSMVLLFSVPPPLAPVVWFGICLFGLFSSYSLLSVLFYAVGIHAAEHLKGGHLQLAGWRETGSLLGVCVASVAPILLALVAGSPMTVFSVGFAVLACLAFWVMRSNWRLWKPAPATKLTTVLADPIARNLLLIALVNSAPLAVSSTLFLFFVEYQLGLESLGGLFLLTFFLAAAFTSRLWAELANRFGTKRTISAAMLVAIVAFSNAIFLDEGNSGWFFVICIFSGAAIGADLTLLPALFSKRMAQVAPNAGAGFGLWGFVTKFSLAFAAIVLFPALELAGFVSGAEEQSATALWALSLGYAGVPLFLKLTALVLFYVLPVEGETQ